MSKTEIWKDADAVNAAIDGMADDLKALIAERGIENPLMVGIHTGGVWVADRLHERLGIADALGHLDISFYRDDFTRIGMHPQVRPSYLPVGVDDRHLILVDDVLQSGRTIRAALNVLFDYGRPASVILATLAERGGRELPIAPDVVGLHAQLDRNEQIKLSGPEPLLMLRGKTPRHASAKSGPGSETAQKSSSHSDSGPT
ncbi:bifunctional pyr operon transcriptional regulator/uracil phosphoribosyltransferase PyrR [Imhoffiella purpurea]|uniref:Uracil phosphoribosyltransferase / Pyrimidine operon regulatory protein PyrR n=1 Tax=Imhoffiella purpurea TaxID=1249627 RepID=W9V8U7_9GAMM|nr:bifunctional pyr operon transcriptional regulator/uracil phosphoribosyltransferase PyrR [Imhoffiella purpurea]EXJ16033.1 Uracil phosphoribosyltransferase / Pyrimidine operon regulatory protein PyrR [Imhoffiella purpurea]